MVLGNFVDLQKIANLEPFFHTILWLNVEFVCVSVWGLQKGKCAKSLASGGGFNKSLKNLFFHNGGSIELRNFSSTPHKKLMERAKERKYFQRGELQTSSDEGGCNNETFQKKVFGQMEGNRELSCRVILKAAVQNKPIVFEIQVSLHICGKSIAINLLEKIFYIFFC